MSQVAMVVRTTLTDGVDKDEYDAWANTATPEIASQLGASMARRMWSRDDAKLHISSYLFNSEEERANAEKNKMPEIMERVNAHWGDRVSRKFEIFDMAQFITTSPS